jgi:hypothetical protein
MAITYSVIKERKIVLLGSRRIEIGGRVSSVSCGNGTVTKENIACEQEIVSSIDMRQLLPDICIRTNE